MAKLPLVLLSCIRDGAPFLTHLLQGRSSLDAIIGILGLDVTAMPSMGALWFLRCLFFLVLISPLIGYAIKRIGMAVPLTFFVLYLLWRFNCYSMPEWVNGFLWYGLSSVGLFAFSFGIFLRFNPGIHISNLCRCIAVAVSVAGCAIVVCSEMSEIVPLFIPFWMYAIWLISGVLAIPKKVTACAFPIYLMHQIILNWWLSFPSIIPAKERIVGFTLCLIVPISVSVLMAWALVKWFPKCAAFIFGGRVKL